MLGVSRQPEVLVLFAVTDLARKLHGASRGLRAGQNESALAKSLKLWGEASRAILDAGKRLQPRQTLAFFRSCVRADLRSKSGLGDIPRSLEALTIELHAMLAQPPRVRA
jgi:DNA polymerase III delta subunit